MVRTRLPCDVSKPVLMTMAIAPLSGGVGTPEASFGFSSSGFPWVTWRTLVPPHKKAFLSRASGSMAASAGLSWMESLSNGVLSPESIASLTMAVPSTKSMSQATPPSSLVRSDRDQIAGEQPIALDLGPLAEPIHEDIIRLDAHAAELVQGSLALPHHGALEHDQHEEGEKRVVPILVQHPQADAEDLEDEEGRYRMLLEELGEGGHGDIEGVDTIVLLETVQLRCGRDAPGLLEFPQRRLGFGID